MIGVLGAHRLLQPLARGERPALTELLQPPVFVPETLSGMELLEHFRVSRADLVFVVDEYGAVQGVISERDLLEAITGEFGTQADEDSWAVQREDGSWLMDGLIPVPELKDRLDVKDLPEEDRGRYNTLAGMVMLLLGRLPDDGRPRGMARLALRGGGPRRQACGQGAGDPHRTTWENKRDQSEPAPPAGGPGPGRAHLRTRRQAAGHRLDGGSRHELDVPGRGRVRRRLP